MMSLWIAQASAAAPIADRSEGWLLDPELVDPGYTQTMAGGDIQTSFPVPPPPREPPPQGDLSWLRDFFEWSAPRAEAAGVDRGRGAAARHPLPFRPRLCRLDRQYPLRPPAR
jgi:hypothetical protein